MKKVLIIILGILFVGCFNSSTPEEVYIEPFEWTIPVPKDWKVSTKFENAFWKERGKQVLKKKFGDKVNTDAFEMVIELNTGLGSYNIFVASVTKYDPQVDRDYGFNKTMRMRAYEKLFRGKKGIDIKTERKSMKIDGVEFDGHFIEVFKNGKKILKQFSFERLYENNDILVIQCLAAPKYYEQMYSAFLKSKFNRKY